jgi:hypothetical protein
MGVSSPVGILNFWLYSWVDNIFQSSLLPVIKDVLFVGLGLGSYLITSKLDILADPMTLYDGSPLQATKNGIVKVKAAIGNKISFLNFILITLLLRFKFSNQELK